MSVQFAGETKRPPDQRLAHVHPCRLQGLHERTDLVDPARVLGRHEPAKRPGNVDPQRPRLASAP